MFTVHVSLCEAEHTVWAAGFSITIQSRSVCSQVDTDINLTEP